MTTKSTAVPTPPPPTAALVPQPNKELKTLGDMLEARRASLAQLVPKHLNADRLMKVALNCVSKTPMLQKCGVSSILQCVFTAAELGLEPGGALGHAYLVPFGTTATLIIGYRGFIQLMRNSGQLASIRAVVVHERDVFKMREGIEQSIKHEPFLDGDPGALKYVYCVAKLKDGSVQIEVMTRAQIDGIRGRSRSSNSGPWVTDYEEMAKKTVVRRIAKYLPLSAEVEKAIEHDNGDFVDGEVVDAGKQALAEAAASATQTAGEKARRKLGIVDIPSLPEEAQVGEQAPSGEPMVSQSDV
jgi:recombination protein RecT